MKMYYIRCKTTMGRRYRMRAPYDARAERVLYWIAITVLPLVVTAGMMVLWVKGV